MFKKGFYEGYNPQSHKDQTRTTVHNYILTDEDEFQLMELTAYLDFMNEEYKIFEWYDGDGTYLIGNWDEYPSESLDFLYICMN